MKHVLCIVSSLILFGPKAGAQSSPSDSTVAVKEEDIPSPDLFEFTTLATIAPEYITLESREGQADDNVIDVLHERFSGLNITSSSGSPGASVEAILRGRNSILNDNAPLIILDGIPLDNSEWGNGNSGVDLSNRLVDINPLDISSVTLLKGPVSSVLYGIRAGNGVIILKTKTGVVSKPVVRVQASLFSERVNKLPERQSEYAQGQYRNGSVQWRGPETGEGFSWGPAVSALEFDGSAYDYDMNGRLVSRGGGNGNAAKAYDPYNFFIGGTSYKLDASISGGTKRTNYYVSIANANSNGFSPNAKFGQTSFFGKVNTSLSDKLEVGLSGHVTSSRAYRLQKGANLQGIMLGLLRTSPTFDNGNGKSGREATDDNLTYELADKSQRSYRAGIYDNPYWSVNKNPFQDNVLRLIGNLSMDYRVSDWLTFHGQFGVDNYNDKRYGGVDINPGRHLGWAFDTRVNYRGLNTDIYAIIDKSISSDLEMKGQIGFNYFQSKIADRTDTGVGLIIPGSFELSNTMTQDSAEVTIRKKIAGIYALLDFDYKDYLLFNFSARNDWSSALPANNRDYLSFAASSGLLISSLPGFDNTGLINLFKIYAGYGRTANDVPAHITENYFVPAVIGGDPYLMPDDEVTFPGGRGFQLSDVLGNDHLRPETTSSIEAGLELRMADSRAGFGLNYYYQQTRDVIMLLNLAGSTGSRISAANAGRINNKGVEIIASGRPFQMNSFKWDISLNFTQWKNTVEEVAPEAVDIVLNGFPSASSRIIEGSAYGAIFGTGFQRNDDGQVLIDAAGWPIQDPNLKVLGNPNPDWTLNINNDFRIGKNLTIVVDLEIKKGGDLWCGTCGTMDYFGTSLQAANERGETVVFEGILPNGSPNNIAVPLADPDVKIDQYYRQRYGFGGLTEMSIFDGSWVRLRRVNVSYNLSSIFSEESFIKSLSISLFANNLWVSTKYPGIDPETNLSGTSNGFGIDYYNNPGSKSFGTTINLSF
jgi:TonB-linked SusC/RagA family outer membrane protein